ncbi:MAG TPA: DEAD/DEAH box helicase, partial [Planctomycetota bacterium]|nr:DEAD/DEAH box helicase [Planctomycetota bacterium]
MVRRGLRERLDGAVSPAETQATSTLPRVVDLDQLFGQVSRSLRSFPQEVADRGRSLLRHVDDPRWDGRRRRFTIDVASPRGEKNRVTVSVVLESGMALGRSCTCGSSVAPGDCEHAHAALFHLYSVLSMGPDAMRLEILDGDDLDDEEDEQWLDGLESFDRLLTGLSSGAKRTLAPRGSRLVWRVRVTDGASGVDFVVEPHEEKALSNGEHGAARPISWRRFLSAPELWSDRAERAIAGLLRHSSLAGSARGSLAGGAFTVDAFDLIAELAGHRSVTSSDAPYERLRIERADIGATLRLTDDGRLKLIATLADLPLERPLRFRLYARGVVVEDIEKRRLLFATLAGARLALVEHLLRDGLSVPATAHEALLERLPAIETVLPIAIPPELEGETVEGDPTLRALFVPRGNRTVAVSFRVRPFGEGMDRVPGFAPARVFRFADGRRLATTRDLDAERNAAERVAGVLGFDREREDEPWTWTLESFEIALDLLSRIRRELQGEVIVEWPEGGELALFSRPADAGALRVSIDDGGEIFRLDGSLDLEDERVALALLLENVESGSRFVETESGRFVEISDDLLERLRTLARIARTQPEGARGIDRGSLPVVEDALEGVADVERSATWENLRKRFQDAATRVPEAPRSLRADLRDYQRDGFRWMLRLSHLRLGACLADDMGLGKTLQTLAVLVERAMHGPALVIAPTSVSDNWIAEAKRFAPALNPILYRETDRRGTARAFQRGDLVVMSYGLLRRDLERLEKQRWGTVVLDEAQSIKNSRSLVAKAARALDARWKLALTGTPIENHLGELWSIFRFLSPDLLGSWEAFKQGFAVPIEKARDDVASSRLAALTRPFILRRTKSEVLSELPPRTDLNLQVELSPEERRLYENARLATLARLAKRDAAGSRDLRFDVLAALTKLRQLACHPRLANPESQVPSSKMALLLETLEQLRQGGHRALIFSQFTSHLDL